MMQTQDISSLLRQIPLFAELDPEDRAEVAKLAKRDTLTAGCTVCRQGQPGFTAYIVESGELRALQVDVQGVEREVRRFRPGDYFGEMALLLGKLCGETVEATQDAALWYLSKGEFDQLLEARPSVRKGLQMERAVARRRRARFRWQEPDEVVLVSLRKHIATLIPKLILPVCGILIVVLGYWFLQFLPGILLAGIASLAIVPLLYVVYRIVDFRNDNYVVTTKRVLHEERVPLIRDLRAEAPLYRIQDIQQIQAGPIARALDYGNLIIETAGEQSHVSFRQIPKPGAVRRIIFEQTQRVQAGARAEERAAMRSALEQRLGTAAPKAAAPSEAAPAQLSSGWRVALQRWTRLLRTVLPPARDEQGDTITWRKHWIVLVRPITPPTLTILAVTLIAIVLLDQVYARVQAVLLVYGVVILFLLLWWLWQFSDWKNDIYQVTASRIVDIERQPLFMREDRREASLGVIQDISLHMPGIVGRLLNYGSVMIETAGAGPFTFDFVKDPRSVQTEIFNRMEAFQLRQRQEVADRRRDELLDWLSAYDEMRRPPSPQAGPSPASPKRY